MHKDFYASGFIYQPQSQQILLHQINSVPPVSPTWLLFEGVYSEKDGPENFFKNMVYSLLDLKIENVYPVYNYFNENTRKDQTIIYATLPESQDFPTKNGHTFAWFTFKDVLKLQVSPQTKHDIVVGQRVIEAAERKRLGLHTFQ